MPMALRAKSAADAARLKRITGFIEEFRYCRDGGEWDIWEEESAARLMDLLPICLAVLMPVSLLQLVGLVILKILLDIDPAGSATPTAAMRVSNGGTRQRQCDNACNYIFHGVFL